MIAVAAVLTVLNSGCAAPGPTGSASDPPASGRVGNGPATNAPGGPSHHNSSEPTGSAVTAASRDPRPPPQTTAPRPDTDVTDRGVCTNPTSLVAPMVYLHTSPTYPAGQTPPVSPLDTQTLYIAGGSPGVGVLCHGSTTAGPPATRAIAPATGTIPYRVSDGENGVWGAVGPGVARVDLALDGSEPSYSFTVDNPDRTQDLRDLGHGWHAFNTDVGYSPANPAATAAAYDGAGHLLGSRTVGGR